MILHTIARYSLVVLIFFSASTHAGLIPLADAIKKFTRPVKHMVWDIITDELTKQAALNEDLLIDEDDARKIVNEILRTCLQAEYSSYAQKQNLELDTHTLNDIVLQTCKQQDGFSCGYHSIFHAKAIQNLFENKKQITAHAVTQEALKYHHLITINDLLEQAQIVEVIDSLGIQNMYFLRINKNSVEPVGGYNNPYIFEELLNKLKYDNDPLCAHFICNTGGHWVLLSAIKYKDQNPQLFFQDSAGNRTIPTDSAQYKFIQSIYAQVCAQSAK